MSNQPDTNDGRLDAATQRRVVRDRYATIVTQESSGCCSDPNCCTDATSRIDADDTARLLGYSSDEIGSVAGEANLGLGCGNPNAIATLEPGMTVVDLGSGGGFDCFLAAQEVGESGHVIGVDMTPEMIEKARETAQENETRNVEFRLGEIEHLPISDDSVDVVISNCVVNLSPDKPQVYREAYRVLKPGGRLAIADVVMTAPVPVNVRADPGSVASCVGGALTIDRLETVLEDAGFEAIEIEPKNESDEFIRNWDPDRDLSEFIISATITGQKPTAPSITEE